MRLITLAAAANTGYGTRRGFSRRPPRGLVCEVPPGGRFPGFRHWGGPVEAREFQEVPQHVRPPRPVCLLRNELVLPPDVGRVASVPIFARSEDGQVCIEEHVGISAHY